MRPLTKRWVDRAAYDLKTAESMLRARRYLYVAFMCQQAIEKLTKGIIHERTNETPPYSHRLVALLSLTEFSASPGQLDFLDLLTGYYINARYPEQKRKLSVSLNKKSCQRLLEETKEFYQCLKRELKT